MNGVVVDTSVWIDLFAGRAVPYLEDALVHGSVIRPPLVVAELVRDARRRRDRVAIADLIRELPSHETPPDHWMPVGELRRSLRGRGLAVSRPDAHVAQCALDRDAVQRSRDAVFARIAAIVRLRLRTS